METYIGFSEDALRNLLTNCTDFSERRRIRAAIRGLVQYGTSDTSAFDYQNKSYEPDHISHRILEEKIKNAADENELKGLLTLATDYQDRRKIRTAMREMRHRKDNDEEGLNNNNNSIRSSSRQPRTMAETQCARKLDLDGIMDEKVLQRMLDETQEYDERMQIRAAMKALWKKQQEARKRYKEKEAETKSKVIGDDQESNGSDEPEDEETILRTRSEKKMYEMPVPKVEEEYPEGTNVNFEAIKDPEILEKLLESSKDFGERTQIRGLLQGLRDAADETAPPPYEMIKKRRLSEGITDVIWLDDIDRIHPSSGGREDLENVEEEDADEFVSYDDIKDVKELEKLLQKATDIGEKRMIRGAIGKLKKAEEEEKAAKCAPPKPKPSPGQADAGKKDAKVANEVKAPEPAAAKTATSSKGKEAETVKKTAEETTKEKAPPKAQEPTKTAKKDDDKSKEKIAPKAEPKDAKDKVEPPKQPSEPKASSAPSKSSKPADEPKAKPESKASSQASKSSKPADEPKAKPESKASSQASKSSKPADEPKAKPESKASSQASKFSKPADEPKAKPESKASSQASKSSKPTEESKAKSESKASSVASKSSKPAEKPAAKPESKPSSVASKSSKPAEEPAAKPESKASSLASKSSKPAEEPKPKTGSKPPWLASKSSKPAEEPAAKPESKAASVDKTIAVKDKGPGDETMTEITEDQIQTPGGEIISKKSVSVNKGPDGSVTKTTTVSTTEVKTDKFGDGEVGGQSSTMVTKRVVSKTMTSSSSSTFEEVSSDGSKHVQETKKDGKVPEEFWKKAEKDKKKPSPLGKSSFGIGNLKNKFQTNNDASNGSAGSPGKFGKGALISSKVSKFSQKFETTSSPSSSALPSKTSDTKSSSCPGNRQCGTPISSPTHKPKTMSGDKASSCPGNGQCGTPIASPTHAPKKTSDVKPSSCPGNGQCGTPIGSPTHAPKKTSDVKPSSCPGNGQCGTPIASPTHAPKKTSDVKPSSCPGNGQCGTPIASPKHMPKMTSDVKPSVCPGNGQCDTPVTSPPGSPKKQLSHVLKEAEVSIINEKFEKEIRNEEKCLPPASVAKAKYAPVQSKLFSPVQSKFGPVKDSFKNGDENLDMCNGQNCQAVPFNIISPDMTNKRFAEDINADMDDDVKAEVELIKVGRRDRSRSPSPGRQVIVGGAISMLGEKYAETRKKTSPRTPRSTSPVFDFKQDSVEVEDRDKMAPVVVDNIEDENVLEKMLEDETDFEERKKIRARLRDLRKKKREDREKRVNQMENDMFKSAQDAKDKSHKIVMDSFDPKKTDSLRLSRDSKTTTTKLDKPEDNNNTIIKAPNKSSVTTVKDDGKTTTTTTKSVKEGAGTKTVSQTTVSKTDDKDTGTKSTSSKTETTSKTQAMVGGGAISSSSKTVAESSSSSSTSTATGEPNQE
ncbi:uncharacterized protein [Amphiura filiformis]|uniref:uncharacterized protein n=1 Tax=Amphiura filiformis TaxID=82378 RepID=UPI003B213A6C